MKSDDEFTFGTKGKKNLGDFDPLKVKTPEESDMWETWVLSVVVHALFFAGIMIIGFLWLFTGRKN